MPGMYDLWRCVDMNACLAVQVDVTSKTEGKTDVDKHVPLLVKYDTRLRENVARNIVEDVTNAVQTAETGACICLW